MTTIANDALTVLVNEAGAILSAAAWTLLTVITGGGLVFAVALRSAAERRPRNRSKRP